MRQILVDLARAATYQKRGGKAEHVPLDKDHLFASPQPDRTLLALDDALRTLSTVDERKARTVELRFFGGLNVRETAEILKVSCETVQRDWKFAKSWLYRELTSRRSNG
jgi:RNA polymerase sigma factor (TIGR02999 family)